MRKSWSVTAGLVFTAALSLMCSRQTPPPVTATEDKSGAEAPAQAAPAPAPLAKDNARCLHCHDNLRKELISRVHQRKKVYCADCHGASLAHMEEQTPRAHPDVVFEREQVDAYCHKCHAHPHRNQAKIERFIQQWEGRTRPHGRSITAKSICTDCHGEHVLAREH